MLPVTDDDIQGLFRDALKKVESANEITRIAIGFIADRDIELAAFLEYRLREKSFGRLDNLLRCLAEGKVEEVKDALGDK
jgi:hypothetical protein